MKNGFNLFVMSTLLAVLMGCEQVVPVDVDEHDPVLVLNAVVNPEDVWRVRLSRSVPVLEQASTDSTGVTGAVIDLLEDGTVIEQLQEEGEGFYRSLNRRPAPGRTYELRATAPGYASVQATQDIPIPMEVELQSLEILASPESDDVTGSPSNEGEAEAILVWEDPPDETNYYFLTVSLGLGQGNAASTSFHLDDPELGGIESVFDELYDGLLFTDATFDGERRELHIRFDYFAGTEPTIILSAVTPAFYDYRRTRQLQDETEDNPFAEPAPIFSNIENGLGIFAGYTPTRIETRIGQPTPEDVWGGYQAVVFTRRTSNAGTIDYLEAGGALLLDLTTEQTVTGRLVIPSALNPNESGEDLELPLRGTYRIDGFTIRFDFENDPFFESARWNYQPDVLRTVFAFEFDEFRIVMRR